MLRILKKKKHLLIISKICMMMKLIYPLEIISLLNKIINRQLAAKNRLNKLYLKIMKMLRRHHLIGILVLIV